MSKFSSIISSKLIVDQETGRSKGYAFFEFLNYKEFNQALNIKEPLIFGKQKLVMNSAKNKYDFFQDEDYYNKQNSNEDMKSLDSFNSSNQTLHLSSTETGISSIRDSKGSINSLINNKSHQSLFIEKNNCEKNFEEICNNSKSNLESQIKNSLRKLSEQYYLNDNKGYLFNYYCSPFIYNQSCRKNLYLLNNFKESLNDNIVYKDCPFELYEDK